MARLMPREKYDHVLVTRGGGADYSFTRLTNEYGWGTQIGLEGYLSTGFAGADFGFLTSLGDIPLDGVTLDQPGIRYLADFVAPTKEPQAREQGRISGTGRLSQLGKLPYSILDRFVQRLR